MFSNNEPNRRGNEDQRDDPLVQSHLHAGHDYQQRSSSANFGRTKYIRALKNSTDFSCVVCCDRAIGFNYGALTCNSCKAFFSRNAFQPSDKLDCRTGQNNCVLLYHVRSKCTKCRLKRCFSMGMRREHFFTDEEKQRRRDRKKIYDRVPLPTFHSPLNVTRAPNQRISLTDWWNIQQIHSSYISAFQQNPISCGESCSDFWFAVSCWSQIKNQIILNFIAFFRQIDEFESLNADDRFILVKYNVLSILLLQKSFGYNRSEGMFSDLPKGIRVMFDYWANSSYETMEFRKNVLYIMETLVTITEQDTILHCLMALIILFSASLFTGQDRVLFHSPLMIHQTQSHFVELLWKYLMAKYDETNTARHFIKIVNAMTMIEMLTKQIKNMLRMDHTHAPTIHHMMPLVKNALNIP